jgi:hypothetical protein
MDNGELKMDNAGFWGRRGLLLSLSIVRFPRGGVPYTVMRGFETVSAIKKFRGSSLGYTCGARIASSGFLINQCLFPA